MTAVTEAATPFPSIAPVTADVNDPVVTCAVATRAIASPVCMIHAMVSPPPHCQRMAREFDAGAGVAMHGVATLTFEGRLALAADRPRRSLKRHRVTA